jgi:prevent-host-death family protein
LDEAQKRLSELVHELVPGGEIVITEAARPVARLASITDRTSLRDLRPTSIGRVLRPYPSSDDDTLAEMLEAQE